MAVLTEAQLGKLMDQCNLTEYTAEPAWDPKICGTVKVDGITISVSRNEIGYSLKVVQGEKVRYIPAGADFDPTATTFSIVLLTCIREYTKNGTLNKVGKTMLRAA
jgi:hypothetical protein